MQLPPAKPNPEFDALLERAKNHVMTKVERDAQRESWVVGEMMLEHPEMTREEAVLIYRKVTGE
jgi:hypothetical protein